MAPGSVRPLGAKKFSAGGLRRQGRGRRCRHRAFRDRSASGGLSGSLPRRCEGKTMNRAIGTESPASSYRVKLVPRPMVINANGMPVPNSHVVEITFPGDTIETMLGPVNTIVGAGAAKIIVGEGRIRGVPL